MQIKKKTMLWVIIAVMFIAVLFLTFKAGAVNTAVSTAGQAVSTVSTASSGMVGGC